ncbi:MAG: SDR family oxidoreductase [Nocardioides sp.]|uniref:SDR family NAD(P)-dependent oxidoreductase n=1 Tax=Nocardioides sp. TaxID=35761 RepID=UPI0039E3AFE9
MTLSNTRNLDQAFASAAARNPLALVTGGAGGIGLGIALALHDAGYAVVVTDISIERLAASFADRGDVGLVEQDVTSEDGWNDLVAMLRDGTDRLDVLVNNAGILHVTARLDELEPATFRRVIDVNLTGTFLGIRSMVPLLRASERASIINLSSGEAFAATPGFGAYTSSKWAVRGLTKTAAVDLAPEGIRCNSIHPWGIDSGMMRGADGTNPIDQLLASIPLGTTGTPGHVGALAIFLAGPDSSFTTGGEFTIDGGFAAYSGY